MGKTIEEKYVEKLLKKITIYSKIVELNYAKLR